MNAGTIRGGLYRGHRGEKGKDDKIGNDGNELEKRSDEYKMILGDSMDTEKARDKWINAVERALEFEAFEKGEKHLDRGLDRVKFNGSYPLRDIPRWML